MGKWNIVYYLLIAERIVGLPPGFSWKTDSARLNEFLAPATPEFNSPTRSMPVIKDEDLRERMNRSTKGVMK